MRIRLATLLGASLVALLVRGVARAEDTAPPAPAAPSGPVVTDKEHDFEWKLPAGWSLVEPTAADKEAGYFAKAKRPVSTGVECTANVYGKATGGTNLETFVSMMKENKLKVLTETEVDETDVEWAGVGAKAVTILGKAENGTSVKWFVRSAIVGDRYHQVSVMSANAAHADVGSEIDEVLAGYRLLSAPPPGDASTAPKSRLRREFPKFGLTWTLPEGGERKLPPVKEGDPERVWKWGFTPEGNPDLDRGQEGTLAIAALVLNDTTLIVGDLRILKTGNDDPSPSGIVDNDRNFEEFAKRTFDGTPIPNTNAEYKVGNAPGAFRTFAGKSQHDGRPLFVRFYFVNLKQQLFQLVVTAHEGAENSESDFLKAMVGGLNWSDTAVGIRGPMVAPGFSTTTGDRKDWKKLGEKHEITGSINVKKPPQFGMLSLANAGGVVFAGEVRKPGAYLFVSISREDSAKIGQGSPPFTLESMIDKHENDWKTDLDNPVTRGKGEKANCKPAQYKTGKGSSYEFRGEKGGVPFLERGWVVKSGKDIVWVRVQFGGKDAEKTLGGDWKDLNNGINFK